MKTKLAYQTDENGFYIGHVYCQPSPLEEGVWLIPRGATDIKPPVNIGPGKIQKFDFQKQGWEVVEHPSVAQQRLMEAEAQQQKEAEGQPKFQFDALVPEERKAIVLQALQNKIENEVDLAFNRLTWHDWSGTPLPQSDELKKLWAQYRKALLSLPLDSFDFSQLKSVDEFPWPMAPAIPPDLGVPEMKE